MSYYIELEVTEDIELKNFLKLIADPPHRIRSIYKKLSELNEPITQGRYTFSDEYAGISDVGLLSRILKNYIRINSLEKNIKFWTLIFTESFLNGTYFILQLFVARSGLLIKIINVFF